ncbi:MAG: hypothetical protein COA86_10505 [Kangiella sp.]|nr:MAG: hypothetical protein COA86_10505 [Kangiella sp.]
MTVYFLACPYSDPDPEVVTKRFDECTKAAAAISLKGIPVYSQITISHPINQSVTENFKGEKVNWAPIDKAFMDKCDAIIVLEMPGWKESGGVQREIDYFKDRGAKVWLFSDFESKYLT